MKIGYKGFNVKDGKLYCRDMEFKVGETYELPDEPIIYKRGFHYCWDLNDVHNYYSLRNSVICEVEPLGDIAADDNGEKCCTNKLKIIRMLTKEEVWQISNTGKDNTGFINTGNRNTGDCNTGNYNTGYRNTGDFNTGNRNTGNRNTGDFNTGNRNTGGCNTGNYNTGYRNTGDCNTGNRNTGDCNTGNRNTGNRNTGDFNTGNRNTGFFNTKENKCYVFDKLSDMTPSEFRNSIYYQAIYSVSFVLTNWIYYTGEEKANDKAKELIGGYLKSYDYKEACLNWWNKLSDESKKIIQEIPNFNADKFYDITGIKV